MAKVEIDNVKMWESIIPRLNNVEDGVYKTFIIDALQDQGLEYKDGHIISILEQKKVPQFELREGNSYICIAPYESFKVGEIYHCKNDYHLFDGVSTYYPDSPPEKYFRPATEEEIKGNNGGIFPISSYDFIKRTLSCGFMHVLDDIRPKEKMCLSNGECFDIEKAFDEQDWDKLSRYLKKYSPATEEEIPPTTVIDPIIREVEPKQENIPTFKELERNGKDELSEFEQMLVSLILRTEKTILTPDGLAKEFAPKLMNLARKQICSEISIDMFCSNIGYINGIYTGHDMDNAYRLGAAEMLNKIKEG